MNDQRYRNRIKRWMVLNLSRFVDECGAVDATKMVECWDLECSDGKMTLNSSHPSWEIASEVAIEVAINYEKK